MGLIQLAIHGPLPAAVIKGQLFDHLPQRAWLEGYDPTLVSSRYFGEFSYENHDGGGDYYKPKWNLLADTNRHRLDLGTTHHWGTDNQYALSLGAEVPLTSESFNFKLIAGFAWYL